MGALIGCREHGRSGTAQVVLMLLGLGLGASGCIEHRQQALNVTPAPSPGCPDMSTGCRKTVWVWAWGAFGTGAPPAATCGSVGLAEVTVRSNPLTFLAGLVSLGIATPRRIEWKCATPDPCPARGLGPSAPLDPR